MSKTATPEKPQKAATIVQSVTDFLAPCRAYRQMVMSLADGQEVAPERRAKVLHGVCRTEAHVREDIERYQRLRDAKAGRERRAEAQTKLPAARQRQASLQGAFNQTYAQLKAEFDRQVAEARKDLDAADVEVDGLSTTIQEANELQSNLWFIADPDLRDEANGLGNRVRQLEREAEECRKFAAKVGRYRQELMNYRRGRLASGLIPDWHPIHHLFNYDHTRLNSGLSETERAHAIQWIEAEEAKAAKARKRLDAIPGEIASHDEQMAKLNAKSLEPERWALAEDIAPEPKPPHYPTGLN